METGKNNNRVPTEQATQIDGVRSGKTIDARKIVINCLKMYDLTEVERMNCQADLADEIINDLVNAGFTSCPC